MSSFVNNDERIDRMAIGEYAYDLTEKHEALCNEDDDIEIEENTSVSAPEKNETQKTVYHIETLKNKDVWVNWQYQTVKGRQTKIPKNSKTSGNAMSNKPETWSNFFTAQSATNTFGYNGIGIMFAPLDNGYAVCGIDIDAHHREDNELATEVLELFKDTYAETSPSGNGYHVLFVAQLDKLPIVNGKLDSKYYYKNPQNELECYISGITNRYFTFTGNQVSTTDKLSDETETLITFLEKYMVRPVKTNNKPPVTTPAPTTETYTAITTPISLTDTELLEKARTSKTGTNFINLYDKGDMSAYNNDHSSADLALCNMLAFWLQGDTEKIDNAFRGSALMREKWEREDYRTATISHAISNCNGEYYTPSKKKQSHKNNTETAPKETEKKSELTYELFCEFLKEKNYSIRYNNITHLYEYTGFSPISYEHLPETVPTILCEELRPLFSSVARSRVLDYITLHATNNRFNPILELIDRERTEKGWDGIDRIKQIFDILGIENSDKLSRTLIRKWLMQAYCGLHNNAKNPFSLDIVLVFQGGQGKGKTTFFQHLAIDDRYFGGGLTLDPRNKDSVMQATSKWISELGEIGSTMKKDIDSVKAFITNAVDEYRVPYGKATLRYPRITSFVGTVNDTQFLIDQTGNRRFATVPLDDNVVIDYTTQIRPFNALQLWVQVADFVENLIENGDSYSRCFRLSRDDISELENRNSEFVKQLKGEQEVIDVLFEQSTSEHGFVIEKKDMTVTEFIQHNSDALRGISAITVGKVLDKLGYPAKKKRVNGIPAQVRSDLPYKYWKN